MPPAEPEVNAPERPQDDPLKQDPVPTVPASVTRPPRIVNTPPTPPMESPVPRYAPRPDDENAPDETVNETATETLIDGDDQADGAPHPADRTATLFAAGPPPASIAPAPPTPEPAFAFAGVAADRLTMALISGPADPLAPTAVLTVATDGSGQYLQIAEAVKAAPPGALVLVAPGTYTQKVTVDKPIELRGSGPLGGTVLAAGNGHALRLTADHAVVRNLAVRGISKLWGDTEVAANHARIPVDHRVRHHLGKPRVRAGRGRCPAPAGRLYRSRR